MTLDELLNVVATWPRELQVEFYERSAIREYEAGLSREDADKLTFYECRQHAPIREQLNLRMEEAV
jgi:hypothetical protein